MGCSVSKKNLYTSSSDMKEKKSHKYVTKEYPITGLSLSKDSPDYDLNENPILKRRKINAHLARK